VLAEQAVARVDEQRALPAFNRRAESHLHVWHTIDHKYMLVDITVDVKQHVTLDGAAAIERMADLAVDIVPRATDCGLKEAVEGGEMLAVALQPPATTVSMNKLHRLIRWRPLGIAAGLTTVRAEKELPHGALPPRAFTDHFGHITAHAGLLQRGFESRVAQLSESERHHIILLFSGL